MQLLPASFSYSTPLFLVEYGPGLVDFYKNGQDALNVMRLADRFKPYGLEIFALPERKYLHFLKELKEIFIWSQDQYQN